MSIPPLKTRRPSGKPPYPMLAVAGVEKSGKSYGAALFSKSDLIDRTFYIEIGEGAADQYGSIPDVRYEIVEHDGSYEGISHAIWAATQQPRPNGRPHAIVVDSMTEFWDLLSDEAQVRANKRAADQAAKNGRNAPVGEAQINMDLWNAAKKRWRRVLDQLRVYDGPVILLCRLEQVAVMDGNAPAKNGARDWKIRAEKNLPFECDAIVKMYAPQSAFLTGVRSTVLQVPPGEELELPQFTIDGLLRMMGLDAADATAPRSYTAPNADAVLTGDEPAPERPAQRQAPRAEDDWNTASGAPLAPPSPVMPSPTSDEINEMVRLLGVKRGVYNDQCAGVVSQMVRRRIADPSALSQSEVRSVIETLTDETDRVQLPTVPEPAPAPAGPGTPDDPVIGRSDHRMMQALFKTANITDRDGQHAFITRILGASVASRNDITKEQFKLIRNALTTGEIPTAPGPNANGEGIAEFDALDQMIRDVASDDAVTEVERAIAAEFDHGTITVADVGILRERLAEHVKQAKAAV